MNRNALLMSVVRILLSTIVIGGVVGIASLFIIPPNHALPLPVSRVESFVKGWITGGFCGAFIGVGIESNRRRIRHDAMGGVIAAVLMMANYLAATLLFNVWIHSNFAAMNWEGSFVSFLTVRTLSFGLLGAIVGAVAHLIGSQFRSTSPPV